MQNVVALSFDPAAERKARLNRLWNPPNGHRSTELDIVTEPILRERRIRDRVRELRLRTQDADKKRLESAIARAIKIEAAARQLKAEKDQRERNRGHRSIDAVIKAVCQHYDIRSLDLISQRRDQPIVRPRHVAMYLCKIATLKSFPQIGRKLGGRDHTTVLHGFRKIQALLDAGDKNIRADVAALKLKLGVE